jgi:hypothetical protein
MEESRTTDNRTESGISGVELAAGIGVMFAATMMIMGGIFQVFQGLAAIMSEELYTANPNFLPDIGVTTWGWLHLVLGVLTAIAGFYLFSGSPAAAGIAMVLAVVGALTNFAFVPYYPLWAVLLIAVDVFVIWAIPRSGVFGE